jgi:hypothetical protein
LQISGCSSCLCSLPILSFFVSLPVVSHTPVGSKLLTDTDVSQRFNICFCISIVVIVSCYTLLFVFHDTCAIPVPVLQFVLVLIRLVF